MQFLYSTFFLPKLAQRTLHVITPGRPYIHHLLNFSFSFYPPSPPAPSLN